MARKNSSNDQTENSDGKMTVQEAGQRGGEATSQNHDKKFYEDIGSEGGKKSGGNFKNNPQRASEAGRKGGQARGEKNRTG